MNILRRPFLDHFGGFCIRSTSGKERNSRDRVKTKARGMEKRTGCSRRNEVVEKAALSCPGSDVGLVACVCGQPGLAV